MERLEDRTTPAKVVDAFGPVLESTGTFIPDRVNVVMTTETNTAADEAALASAPFALKVTPLGFGIYTVSLAEGTDISAAVSYYSTQSGVVSAAPDEIVQLQATPNDQYFSLLYGMTKIGAPTVWDTTTGNSNFVVAVIDSGVDYNHPELAGNIWSNTDEIAGNGVDDDGNGFVDDIRGWDFANNDNNPMDDNGHGTHVAGTIGAVGNNSIGVAGVNWSVKIMPLKFLAANGSGSLSAAVGALNYAVANGAKVSNNSWGGGGFSSALSTAISRARDAGHIFVAAAGNEGSNNDAIASYPANYNFDNVVSVAATDSNDALASFSNYGATTVDLAAPGVNIASLAPNNGYVYMSGTSMATPHVTGAIALYWGANPNLTYTQVIDKLKSSVDVIPSLSGRVATGGRLNVARMFEGVSPPPPVAPKVTSAVFNGAGGANFSSVRVTFDRAIDAGSFTTDDITSFTGPNGAIAATGVTAVSSTQFDITFAPQTTAGNYSITFGPNITSGGVQMDQNGNGTPGEGGDVFIAGGTLVTTVTNTYTRGGLPISLIDVGTRTVTMTIADNLTISDLNVNISLTHTWLSDLVIKLRGPDGTTVTLFNRRGGSANNLTGTSFNDEAGTAISAGAAPFSGSFRPEQALSAFDGKNLAGTWTLTIQDLVAQDTGNLTAWSLVVTGTAGAGGSGRARAMGFVEGAVASDTGGVEDALAESIAESAADVSSNANTWSTLVGETASSSGNMMWMAPAEDREESRPSQPQEVTNNRDALPTLSNDSRAPASAPAFAALYLAPADEDSNGEDADDFSPIIAE